MDRPKIYLDEPIKLHGIKVTHTRQGLVYLINHYERCLSIATPAQMSEAAREHCKKLIENYKIHIKLYDRPEQNNIKESK